MLIIPYIDVSINADWSDWQHYPNGRPNPIYSQQVINYGLDGVIMGFITLSSAGTACWAAQPTMPWDWALPMADDLKKAGKKVVVSFGGASNSDISKSFTVDELVATYNQVIKGYNAYQLDFDLENGLYNIDNICAALKQIAATNPSVLLSFTLPTLPTGLVAEGMNIITKAKAAGLTFIVNGMAMDYYMEEFKDKMGEAAVQACTSIKNQLKTVDSSLSDAQAFSRCGVTPMIGLNDDLSMFTLPDATMVGTFGKQNNISFCSFWSLNRDNPSSFTYVDLTSSSNPAQKASGDYSKAFVNAPK